MSTQMRAAWARRTDDELLRAHFLEELTADGRAVVHELVLEKLGPIEAYLRPFADAQGARIASFPVRGFEADHQPLMWGHVVVTANGIGFLPGGLEDLGSYGQVVTSYGSLAGAVGGGVGSLLGTVAESFVTGVNRARHHVLDLTALATAAAAAVPLPLVARLEPHAVWLGPGDLDEVHWGPDFGEVLLAGQRLFCLDLDVDVLEIITAWTDGLDLPLTLLDREPL